MVPSFGAGDNEAEFFDKSTGKQVCMEQDGVALVLPILFSDSNQSG